MFRGDGPPRNQRRREKMSATAHKNLLVFVTMLVLTAAVGGGSSRAACIVDGNCNPADGEAPGNCMDCDFVPDCDNAVCDCGILPGPCDPHEKLELFWCISDCSSVISCGDGYCEGFENNTSCPADCPLVNCGDGVCVFSDGENHHSCPADCPAYPLSCLVPEDPCDPTAGENAENCPHCFFLPLCGDVTCNGGEDPTNCPMDCCAGDPDCDDANPCTDESCIASTCQYSYNTDPCDDEDACTIGDVCALGVCAGSAVDCSSLSDDCNEVTCDPEGPEGNCDIVTPHADGTLCDDGLWCSPEDFCYQGECTGTGDPCDLDEVCNEATASCVECLTDNDCDDLDECTVRNCNANGTCEEIYAPPGTSCGNPADTECTDPDTCDGAGTCQQNHAPNDTFCAAGQGAYTCQEGVCAQSTFAVTELDEGQFFGAIPYAAVCTETTAFIAGAGLDDTETKHGVIWELPGGDPWVVVELNELGADTSEAIAVDCNADGLPDDPDCVAAGAVGSGISELPAYWTHNAATGDWTGMLAELPGGGFTGGRFDDVQAAVLAFTAAGATWSPDGTDKATVWPDIQHGPILLPELVPLPSIASGANAIAVDEAGKLSVGGYAENASKKPQPVVWREIAPETVFELHLLPVVDGAIGGSVNTLRFVDIPDIVDRLVAGGTMMTAAGGQIGVFWSCDITPGGEPDFDSCVATDLPPLPAFENSVVRSVVPPDPCGPLAPDPCPGDEGWICSGSSFFGEGSDPFMGRATLWRVGFYDIPAVVEGIVDLTDLAGDDLPGGESLVLHTASRIRTHSGTELPLDFCQGYVCAYSHLPAGGASRDAPLPHAAVLTAQPQQNIPAVSAWGMAAMTLLVLTAGTLVLARRRRLVTAS